MQRPISASELQAAGREAMGADVRDAERQPSHRLDLPPWDMNVCKCCGHEGLREGNFCECQSVPDWYMDEDQNVECNMHRIKRWTREAMRGD